MKAVDPSERRTHIKMDVGINCMTKYGMMPLELRNTGVAAYLAFDWYDDLEEERRPWVCYLRMV